MFTASLAGGVFRHYGSVPVLVTEVIPASEAPTAVAICVMGQRLLIADKTSGILMTDALPPVSDPRWKKPLKVAKVKIARNQFALTELDSDCQLIDLGDRDVLVLANKNAYLMHIAHDFKVASFARVCCYHLSPPHA